MLQAKSAEFGVEVFTSDSVRFQSKFHQIRNAKRAEGNGIFESLRCRLVSEHIVFVINGDGDANGNGKGNGQAV